ncbi:MAG TPA: hypothetical protein VFT22_40775 [Kofleriaceae bacterium]|nr:hypothetical protein [Kofleriaceae bacterium]
MSVLRLSVLLFLISSMGGSVASAESIDEAVEPLVVARAPGNEDSFTPGLTHSAASGRGIATGTASWNGASHTTSVDLNGEVQIWGPVRLVLRVDNALNDVDAKARPGIGGAVQFLSEGKHGVSASAYFLYKAEGITEAEGELEGLISFAKQLGAVHGTLNLAYGQDPEGNERDGEAALGLHIEPIRGLFTGVVGRYRDALGSSGDKGTGILRDALGGVSATYVIGRFGITGTAGVAGIKTVSSGSMQGGAEAAMSVGAVF